MTVQASARVEVQLSPGVWTDITGDVLVETEIRWSRGIRGSGPTDRVASTGTLECSLRNDADPKTGRLKGWYSPNHPNVRAGWMHDIPIRLVGRYLGVDRPIWRGRIRTIDPTPGDTPKRVSVLAQDSFGDFAETKVREIPPQVDVTEVDLIQAVIDALPTENQPVATSFDAALDSYPFAFDNVGAGTVALGLLSDAMISAYGRLFQAADGTLRYINRHSDALADSVLTLIDSDLLAEAPPRAPSSRSSVASLVRATFHPKTPVPSTDLYVSTEATPVAPGQTVTVWGSYSDPNNPQRLIGGDDFITPLVAGTDYVANSAADGSGTDRTASLTAVATPFSTTVKFDLTNTFTDTIHVTQRKLRGTGIFDNAPQTVESPQGTIGRPIEIDLLFQADGNIAQDLVDYIYGVFGVLSRQAEEVSFNPQQSNARMLAALTTEIGSVITLSESMTGLDGVELMVQAIDGTVRGGPGGFYFDIRYVTAPHGASSAFVLDDPVLGVLDSADGPLAYA